MYKECGMYFSKRFVFGWLMLLVSYPVHASYNDQYYNKKVMCNLWPCYTFCPICALIQFLPSPAPASKVQCVLKCLIKWHTW